MSSLIARLGFLVILILVIVLAAGRVAQPPRPVLLGTIAGETASLEIDDSGVICLSRSAKPPRAQLVYLRSGQNPQILADAPDIPGMAINDQHLFFLERSSNGSGALKQVSLSGGEMQTFRSSLQNPQGLMVEEGFVFWTEKHSPGSIGQKLPQLVGLNPRIRVKMMPLSGGMPKDLAVLNSYSLQDEVRFLGVDSGFLYLLVQQFMSSTRKATIFYRVPRQGGAVERIAAEPGQQTGLIAGEVLYHTAPSEESSEPLAFTSIRKIALADRRSQTLTDWLPTAGSLGRDGSVVYYRARDRLWQVPEAFGHSREVAHFIPTPYAAVMEGGRLYVAYKEPSEGSRVAMFERLPRFRRELKP